MAIRITKAKQRIIGRMLARIVVKGVEPAGAQVGGQIAKMKIDARGKMQQLAPKLFAKWTELVNKCKRRRSAAMPDILYSYFIERV